MPNWISILISCIALIVSCVTAWLTFFRRGQLMMTQPTVVFLGPDGSAFDSNKNKSYLRTLLYCTAKRGFVLESLYLALSRNETKQNFNIWVYGDKGNLKRGSGLFIPQEGITFDHHFLLPEDGANFPFVAGTYVLRVFAKGVGRRSTYGLMTINLVVSDTHAKALTDAHSGIYFDWGPDQQAYHSHIQSRPITMDAEKLLQIIGEKNAG